MAMIMSKAVLRPRIPRISQAHTARNLTIFPSRRPFTDKKRVLPVRKIASKRHKTPMKLYGRGKRFHIRLEKKA